MTTHEALQAKKNDIWQKLIAVHKSVIYGDNDRKEQRVMMQIDKLNRDLQAIVRVQRMFADETPQTGIEMIEGGVTNDNE